MLERRDNYAIQVREAKKLFLSYDQRALEAKFGLKTDDQYIYVNLLCYPYRVQRDTGDLEYWDAGYWKDGNSFDEVLTLFDLLCGSRERRGITGRWKTLEAFGRAFHRNLLEARDPFAERIDGALPAFRAACQALGGEKLPQGDAGFALPFFEDLRLGVIFWAGDEEFPPALRFLWDENADRYLRYETMYYAISLARRRIGEKMDLISGPSGGAQGTR